MREPAALKQLRFIASLGLAPGQAIPAMIEQLERAIPCSFANLFWVDRFGVPQDAYIPYLIPSAMDAYIGGQAALRAKPDEPSLDKLALSPQDLNAHTMFDELRIRETFVYNEVFKPYSVGRWVDMTIRNSDGDPVAVLIVNRDPGAAPWTRTELDTLWSVRPHFSAALAACPGGIGQPTAEPGGSTDCGGYLVIEANGDVSLNAGAASLLLSQFCGLPFADGVYHQSLVSPLPDQVRALLNRARAIGRGLASEPACAERDTPWGRVAIRIHPENAQAACHHPADRHIAVLERRLPRSAVVARRIGDFDLSRRERELAYYIGQSMSFDSISARMGITTETLRSYAKSIYAKLGIDGRGALEASLTSLH